MNKNDYYFKYLKYKNKYLQLKKQYGGVIKPCEETSKNVEQQSVGHLLTNFDCDYEKIKQKLGETKLNAFNYNEFNRINAVNKRLGQTILTLELLKQRNFPIVHLFMNGFPMDLVIPMYKRNDISYIRNYLLEKYKDLNGIHTAGYTPEQLRKYGFSIKELLTDGNYTAAEFKKSKLNLSSFLDWNNISPKMLIKAGYTSKEISTAGFTIQYFQKNKLLFGYENIIKFGFTANEIRDYCKVNNLQLTVLNMSIYSIEVLKQAGFTDEEIQQYKK